MENMRQTKYDKYFITIDGKIWSEKTHKFLSPFLKNGYLAINLSIDNKYQSVYIHRLVAEAFIPNPDNLPCVNHKDENKLNNNIDNLEWCSVAYNNTWGTARQRASETKKQTAPRRGNHAEAVPVAMCDPNTHDIIQTFDSMASAAEFLNLDIIKGRNGISACIRGRQKTAWNYWWKKI